jgi:hypothetical protein
MRHKEDGNIPSLLRHLDASATPLLEELEPADLVALLDDLLAWLEEVEPRTRRYLSRRARQGRSRDLDEQMVQDLWWYRLLRANVTCLREKVVQGQP